ncbi:MULTISPECIES: acetate/propionate family kinase [unclassified Pedobacter]|uniref:acetate/propionate family kinase n=1 Tax=unclassified Pedobacter TaxID=2628915 RepID=UPI0014221F7C|nr:MULTISPECIES: acetate kinase [unclassified Pedobacter]NII83022.1 acetate kinase [Pedobacter sp. SG908]NMN37040.1 acetate kinase [Pedobacter sp. SG918]
MNILVINSGSSSLKYQLFKMPKKSPVCSGLVERIGIEGSFIKHTVYTNNKKHSIEETGFISNHGEALKQVLALLTEGEYAVIASPDDIAAVGHRVVHGGEHFSGPTIITDDVKHQIKKLFSLAPLHNPVNYKCIEVAEQTFVNARQIAVFDTAFHQTIPEQAYRYAIPEWYYKEHGIRVYGFHGTSHKYVSEQAINWLNKKDTKIISIHLGNGCSITAIKNGKSIDTSMGFGPLSGLMMGTRSGDIDPSVIFHLMEHSGYTLEQLSALLNKQSGLLGVGGSSDMRDIRKMVSEGNAAAALAINLYAYRIKKFIGAYAAVLNGIDAIIFTAGVGENDSNMREAVCSELDYLGIELDPNQNTAYKGELKEINTTDSKVKILVIPTNEEYEIAHQCFGLLT